MQASSATYLDDFLARLDQWRHLGSTELGNSTRLIARATHRAPEAWLHLVFRPLSDGEITEIETMIHVQFPEVVRAFFTRMNGVSIFSGSLDIFGLRSRTAPGLEFIFQPFNIATLNFSERPKDALPNHVFLGVVARPEFNAPIYLDLNDLAVHQCETRDSVRPSRSWPGFPEMLLGEYDRLEKLFDEQGRRMAWE